jgi:hypothetical protein
MQMTAGALRTLRTSITGLSRSGLAQNEVIPLGGLIDRRLHVIIDWIACSV